MQNGRNAVKVESPKSILPSTASRASPSVLSSQGPPLRRKRPLRSAVAHVRSYAIPDSDTDAEMSDEPEKKVVKETSMQLWVRHLGELLKVEQKKVGTIQRFCGLMTNIVLQVSRP